MDGLDDVARDISVSHAQELTERAGGLGLAWVDAEAPHAMLTRAGRQYLERDGNVHHDVVEFLPAWIDDLNAREALLRAGSTVVQDFRASVLVGQALPHAHGLTPAAFQHALTERSAHDLYAAAVALMARLSAGAPAGCLAEEIIAVELIAEATDRLETMDLGDAAHAEAIESLKGLFELFGDADVLDLFDMHEPSDAALAAHTERNIQLGVVDQRIEAWFRPFGETAPTGYLQAPPEEPSP